MKIHDLNESQLYVSAIKECVSPIKSSNISLISCETIGDSEWKKFGRFIKPYWD